MKDVNLGKTQSPVSPQQRRQWWWDSHQNDSHSIILSDDLQTEYGALQDLVRTTGQVQKHASRAVSTLILQCLLTVRDMEFRAGP